MSQVLVALYGYSHVGILRRVNALVKTDLLLIGIFSWRPMAQMSWKVSMVANHKSNCQHSPVCGGQCRVLSNWS